MEEEADDEEEEEEDGDDVMRSLGCLTTTKR